MFWLGNALLLPQPDGVPLLGRRTLPAKLASMDWEPLRCRLVEPERLPCEEKRGLCMCPLLWRFLIKLSRFLSRGRLSGLLSSPGAYMLSLRPTMRILFRLGSSVILAAMVESIGVDMGLEYLDGPGSGKSDGVVERMLVRVVLNEPPTLVSRVVVRPKMLLVFRFLPLPFLELCCATPAGVAELPAAAPMPRPTLRRLKLTLLWCLPCARIFCKA